MANEIHGRDSHGNSFPIVGLVNRDGDKVEDLASAEAVVVKVAADDFVGVAKEMVTIYTVH